MKTLIYFLKNDKTMYRKIYNKDLPATISYQNKNYILNENFYIFKNKKYYYFDVNNIMPLNSIVKDNDIAIYLHGIINEHSISELWNSITTPLFMYLIMIIMGGLFGFIIGMVIK